MEIEKITICTWNCLGPRKDTETEMNIWIEKIKWLKENFKADMYVIQECSKAQVDYIRGTGSGWNYAAWYGDEIDWFMRGTAIFSDKRYFTEREEFFHNSKFRYVVPYRIKTKKLNFILFNVWTKAKPQNPEYEREAYFFYENNVKEALNYYDSKGYLDKELLVGDFNFGRSVSEVKESFGKILDKYEFSLSAVVTDALVTYHHNNGKYYFNDICYGKNLRIDLLKKGDFEDPGNTSDHIPLIFEITSEH